MRIETSLENVFVYQDGKVMTAAHQVSNVIAPVSHAQAQALTNAPLALMEMFLLTQHVCPVMELAKRVQVLHRISVLPAAQVLSSMTITNVKLVI